jgi:hypothetical protein
MESCIWSTSPYVSLRTPETDAGTDAGRKLRPDGTTRGNRTNRHTCRMHWRENVQSLPEQMRNPLPPWDTVATGSFFYAPTEKNCDYPQTRTGGYADTVENRTA